jgi:hypothetical protein
MSKNSPLNTSCGDFAFLNRLTRQQAADGGYRVFYREKPCVKCGEHKFRVGPQVHCRSCDLRQTAKTKGRNRIKEFGVSSMLSIDEKLEQIRLVKELKDFD